MLSVGDFLGAVSRSCARGGAVLVAELEQSLAGV